MNIWNFIQKQNYSGSIDDRNILIDSIEQNNKNIWNKYRKEKGNCSLRGLTVRGLHFNGYDFSCTDFTDSNLLTLRLGNTLFRNSVFENTKIEHCTGREICFNKSSISSSFFLGTSFNKATFSGATIVNTEFIGAKLTNAAFHNTNITKSSFFQAALRRGQIIGSSLIENDFREADLSSITIKKTDVSGSKFYGIKNKNWILEDVSCTHAFWDRNGEIKQVYTNGSFESYYSKTCDIEIEYPSGISPLSYHALPFLIQEINDKYKDKCQINLESLNGNLGAGLVTLSLKMINSSLDTEVVQDEIKNIILLYEKEKDIIKKQYISELAEKNNMLVDAYTSIHRFNKKQGKLIDGSTIPAKEKMLCIVFFDLVKFSQKPTEARSKILQSMYMLVNATLKTQMSVTQNTWGDGTVFTTDDIQTGIDFALQIRDIANVLGTSIRFGIDYGPTNISFNEIQDKPDIDGEHVNFAARLEPVCDENRILISKNVYYKLFNNENYEFESVKIQFKKPISGVTEEDKISAYYISKKAV